MMGVTEPLPWEGRDFGRQSQKERNVEVFTYLRNMLQDVNERMEKVREEEQVIQKRIREVINVLWRFNLRILEFGVLMTH